MSEITSSEETITLIDKFIKEERLISHHKISYNNFISNGLERIIKDYPPIYCETTNEDNVKKSIKIEFKKGVLGLPQFIESDGSITYTTPNECRIRGLSYASPYNLDVLITIKKSDLEGNNEVVNIVNDKIIFNLPIMVRSKYCVLYSKYDKSECEYDIGGYYIINGTERILIPQERINYNRCYIYKKPICMEIRSVNSSPRKHPILVKINYINKQFKISTVFIKKPIPIIIIMKALTIFDNDNNYDTDENILTYFEDEFSKDIITSSIEDAYKYSNKYVCLKWLCDNNSSLEYKSKKDKIECIKENLKKDFLAHIGNDNNSLIKKYFYIIYCLKKFISILKLPDEEKHFEYDDRDHFGNKRIDSDGTLLSQVFINGFNRFYNECNATVDKKLKSINQYMKDFSFDNVMSFFNITKDMFSSLSTGNWGSKIYAKTGVSQVLSRLNFMSTLSHSRRISTPVAKNGATIKARQIHQTQWGIICPAETPEGEPCGLVKNMALLCHITINLHCEDVIKEYIKTLNLNEISPNDDNFLFLNGEMLYSFDKKDYKKIYLNIKSQKCKIIPYDASVFYKEKDKGIDIYIYTDEGRVTRPLLVVKNNKLLLSKDDLKLSFDDLVKKGVIEYLEPNEQENCYIATRVEQLYDNFSQKKENDDENDETFTHCEIHPCSILGVMASIIPLPDHNQSPRNCYQSAMGKQALGIYSLKYSQRVDTMGHLLHYPQKPLLSTIAAKAFKYDEMPSGTNVILLVGCFEFNQEDALVINQSSIDRGLFSSTFFRTYLDKETKSSSKEEFFEKTSNKRGMKVDDDGLSPIGTVVNDRDIIISKSGDNPYNTSIRYGENGIVDNVCISTSKEGVKLAKVTIRQYRVPQIGDKFASRHSQKGTCGMVFRQEDLPFTAEGICPDLIINPHAIPSRMTIAQLIESALGKVKCLSDKYKGDATPFTSKNFINDISKYLTDLGYSKYGKEVLYSGITGEKLEGEMFIGPVYYQRLKHMVQDKVHSRTRGPMQLLVRQPVEGRSRDGGLRFGTMESDCMIGHGSTSFLNGRLLRHSDEYITRICTYCGIFGTVIDKLNPGVYTCKKCGNDSITKVRIPYALKLLQQDLIAMNINMKINV